MPLKGNNFHLDFRTRYDAPRARAAAVAPAGACNSARNPLVAPRRQRAMADEDVSLLNGAQDRQRDVEEAEEQVEEFDLRKLTLTDLWAALKELHRLKGGDTSTGSFSEALARGIVNVGCARRSARACGRARSPRPSAASAAMRPRRAAACCTPARWRWR